MPRAKNPNRPDFKPLRPPYPIPTDLLVRLGEAALKAVRETRSDYQGPVDAILRHWPPTVGMGHFRPPNLYGRASQTYRSISLDITQTVSQLLSTFSHELAHLGILEHGDDHSDLTADLLAHMITGPHIDELRAALRLK